MKKIIIKYLSGEISPEELKALKQWLAVPRNKEKFKEYVRVQHILNTMHPLVTSDEAYAKVFQKINQKPPRVKNFPYTNWMKYAAIFIGLFAIGGFLLFQEVTSGVVVPDNQITLELEDGTLRTVEEESRQVIRRENGLHISQNKNKLVYTAESLESSGKIRYNILSVPYGRQFQVALADGTEVILDAGTKLKYPVSFAAGENRIVYLEGQAFFKVAEDPTRPFLVSTENMEVRVLGTHFNVSAYPEDLRTSAVLISGSVAATFEEADNLNSRSVVLKPGERARVENGRMEVDYVNVDKYTAWTNGELMFFNEVFASITKKLERRYDVKINNKYPALENIRITGNFRTETIEQVLETFQRHTPFEYTIKDKIITLTPPDQ